MIVKEASSASAYVIAGVLLALAFAGPLSTDGVACPTGGWEVTPTRGELDGCCATLVRPTAEPGLVAAAAGPLSVGTAVLGVTVRGSRPGREASRVTSFHRDPLHHPKEAPLLRRLGSEYSILDGVMIPAVLDGEFSFAIPGRATLEPRTGISSEPPAW